MTTASTETRRSPWTRSATSSDAISASRRKVWVTTMAPPRTCGARSSTRLSRCNAANRALDPRWVIRSCGGTRSDSALLEPLARDAKALYGSRYAAVDRHLQEHFLDVAFGQAI